MKRFLPVTKAAHWNEGYMYKNTESLKTEKSSPNHQFYMCCACDDSNEYMSYCQHLERSWWKVGYVPITWSWWWCILLCCVTKCHVTRWFQCCVVLLVNTTVLEARSKSISSISVRLVMEGWALSEPVSLHRCYWTRWGAFLSPALSNHRTLTQLT